MTFETKFAVYLKLVEIFFITYIIFFSSDSVEPDTDVITIEKN